MSSTSDSRMTGSIDGLLAWTVKETGPPGSGTLLGVARLATAMAGWTSVMTTCAWAVSVMVLPSSSLAMASMMSSRTSSASPVTGPMAEQPYVAPTAIVCGREQSPRPSRSP